VVKKIAVMQQRSTEQRSNCWFKTSSDKLQNFNQSVRSLETDWLTTVYSLTEQSDYCQMLNQLLKVSQQFVEDAVKICNIFGFLNLLFCRTFCRTSCCRWRQINSKQILKQRRSKVWRRCSRQLEQPKKTAYRSNKSVQNCHKKINIRGRIIILLFD